MLDVPPLYVFFTCQPGAEVALKQLLAAQQPGWRPSFSRPGFVSFKTADGPSGLSGPLPVFARTRSVSLGKINAGLLSEGVSALWQLEGLGTLKGEHGLRGLHVWQRDTKLPGEDGYEPHVTTLAEEARRAILERGTEFEGLSRPTVATNPSVAIGDLVLDVVLVEPNEWWVGYHRAQTRVERWPGGILPLAIPEDVISRAYLKMEEALKWAALPTAVGDLWGELGCAPGGASQSLLDRGFNVLGVDPAEVDESVRKHRHFAHLRKRVADLRRSDLSQVRWLAADINQPPNYTLDAVEGVVSYPGCTIRGLVLTLKLANWELGSAENLEAYAARVRSWGYRDVRLKQLVHNRRELCLVALRSRAQRRMVRQRSRQRTVPQPPTLPEGETHSGRHDRAGEPKPSFDPPHARLAGPHFR